MTSIPSPHPEVRSIPAEHLGREGMVTVWDAEGRYVGCMGVNAWTRLVEEATETLRAERGAPHPVNDPCSGPREEMFCPTCGCADAGRDRDGHLLYGRWLSYRDFEKILLSLGATGSDVQRLWPRATTLFSVEKDGPAVIVYQDEVVDLITDAQLYGNVCLKPDEHGVNVRVDPRSIRGTL